MVRFNSLRIAELTGSEISCFRLKDGSSLKVLANDKRVEYYILKNGKVLDRDVFQGRREYVDIQYQRIVEDFLPKVDKKEFKRELSFPNFVQTIIDDFKDRVII